jgi:hypothetical protein
MLWGAHVFQAVHMRAVRCDVCGSRAMTAAAQCPTCAHHFDLRDGRGELFPLAYCSSCQSYYRESLGECRWCHTKPERPPIGPRVWRGVGAAALVALVITARLLQDDGSLDSAIEHAKTAAKKAAPPLAADTALAQTLAVSKTPVFQAPIARADSTPADTTVRDSNPETPVTRIAEPPVTRVVATKEVALPPAPVPTVQAPPPVAAKPRVVASTKAAAPAASKTRRTTRWVSSISRDWVVVRADASKRSRLVASIGPNSRVQLGEARGNWRRIRAKGFAGWVEQGAAFRVVASR